MSTRHLALNSTLAFLALAAVQPAFAFTPGTADRPVNFPHALFIPDTPGLGIWQQSPNATSPVPPQNWQVLNNFQYPGAGETANHAYIKKPIQAVDWATLIANAPFFDGFGNALFAPGDGNDLLVGVDGLINSSGIWIGSGNVTFFALDPSARIFNQTGPSGIPLKINLMRTTVEGQDGSPARQPVNLPPSVDIGVQLENTATSVPTEFNLEGGTVTLSADNLLFAVRIRSYGTKGTMVINTPHPFGLANVEVVSGIKFRVKDLSASTPSRTLTTDFFAGPTFNPANGAIFNNTSVIEVEGEGNLTFNGNLTGDGNLFGLGLGLSVNGSGIVTLNGTNNFTAGLIVNSGTLAFGNNAAANGISPLTINAGAIQASGGARTIFPPLTEVAGDFAVTGLQDLTIDGPVHVASPSKTITVSAPSVTFLGPISNGGLIKSGPGTMVLSGINTYQGGTTVNQGVLQLNNGGPSGAIRGVVTINSGGTLKLNAPQSLGTEPGSKIDTANINGGMLDNVADGDNGWGWTVNLSGGTLRSNNGVNTPGTPKLYSMGGGSLINSLSSAVPSLIAGRLDLRDGNPGNQLEFNVADGAPADDLVVRAAITETGGSLGITKSGPGTMALVAGPDNQVGSGSSYTGSTIVNAGTLAVDGNQEANRFSPNHLVTVNNGGTFEIRGVNALPILTDAIDITVNQGGVLRAVSGGSANMGASPASHAHLRNINLNGGTVDLTYSGTLAAFDGESFEMNGSLTVGGAAPSLIQSAVSPTRQGIALAGLRTFHVNDVTSNATVDLTVNAELESTGLTPEDDGLRKTGIGTLLLNRSNTYLGQTIVEEGTLLVNGSLTGATILNGGVLGGTGSAKAITVNSNGTLAPGVAIGTLIAESLTFNGGALALEMNSSTVVSDAILVLGDLALGLNPVSMTIDDLGPGVQLPVGTELAFLGYTGNWDGNFLHYQGSPLPDDGLFFIGSHLFRMDYGDTNQKVFKFVAVPEPSSAILLAVAVFASCSLRIRSRRSHI